MILARHKESPLLLWSESANSWTTNADVATVYEAEQNPRLPADAVWIDEYELREQEFAALILACDAAEMFLSEESRQRVTNGLRVGPGVIDVIARRAKHILDEAQSYTQLYPDDLPDRAADEQELDAAVLGREVSELSSGDYAMAVIGALVEHRTEKRHYQGKNGQTTAVPRVGIVANCEFQDTHDPDLATPVLEVHWEGDDFTRATTPDAIIFRRQHLRHLSVDQPIQCRKSWFTLADSVTTPHRLTLLDPLARRKYKLELDRKLYAHAVRHALVEHVSTGKLGLIMGVSVDASEMHSWIPLVRVQWEDEPEPQQVAARDLRFHRALFQHLEIDQRLGSQ